MSPRTHARGTSRTARPSGHRRDAVVQVEGLGDVLDVGCGRDDVERRCLTVADQAFPGLQRAAQWRGSPCNPGVGGDSHRAAQSDTCRQPLASPDTASSQCGASTALRQREARYFVGTGRRTVHPTPPARWAQLPQKIRGRTVHHFGSPRNQRSPPERFPPGCAPPTPPRKALPATSSGSRCGRRGSRPRCGTC